MTHYQTVKQVIQDRARLCIVTKKRTPEQILAYYDAGERIFGENHAQELSEKASSLPKDIQWQFIGHLQRNKVRQVVPIVSCIQSLDSLELAEAIEKQCAAVHRIMPVYAEFHLAEQDERKTGLKKEEAFDFFDACRKYPHLNLCGIMVMGPHTEDEEKIRSVFLEAHDLFLSLQKKYSPKEITTLSMGMSADYRIAVECGSTMVRIGTYLFTQEGD